MYSSEINKVIDSLQALIFPTIIPKKLVEKIAELAFTVEVNAGDFFLKNGKVCDGAYFLVKGVARSYYYLGERQITSRLMENECIITSWISFYTQAPSTECIEALEDCTSVYMSYRDIMKLYDEFHQFNTIGRKLIEYSYYLSEKRIQLLRGLPANERYAQFVREHASIAAKVPLKYIASYLGVTDVTISRIRASYKKRV